MLRVDGLEVAYGDLQVVWGVSFKVPKESIVTILGPNGAGKSTTLLAITGLLPIKAGSVSFNGHSLIGVPTHQMVERGVVLIPRGEVNFCVPHRWKNLEIGAYSAKSARPSREKTMEEVLGDLSPARRALVAESRNAEWW